MKTISQMVLIVFLSITGTANNINITNTTTGQNTSAGVNHSSNFTLAQFEISFDNSWRTITYSSNWDSEWICVRYWIIGDELNHACLTASDYNNSSVTTFDIEAGLQIPGTAFIAKIFEISNPLTSPLSVCLLYLLHAFTSNEGFMPVANTSAISGWEDSFINHHHSHQHLINCLSMDCNPVTHS